MRSKQVLYLKKNNKAQTNKIVHNSAIKSMKFSFKIKL